MAEAKTIEREGKYQVQVRAPEYPVWTDYKGPQKTVADAMALENEWHLQEKAQTGDAPDLTSDSGKPNKRAIKDAAQSMVNQQAAATGQDQAEDRMQGQ